MSGRCRMLVLVLSATVLSSGVVAFGAQRSGPRPAPDPALGDGGVSAFYVWDQEVQAAQVLAGQWKAAVVAKGGFEELPLE